MLPVNPLNLFELRIVDHCPPHFYAVDFDCTVNAKKLSDWIYENLQGRFYFGDVFVTKQGKQMLCKRAAFEVHSEASYFAIVLPEINRTNLTF